MVNVGAGPTYSRSVFEGGEYSVCKSPPSDSSIISAWDVIMWAGKMVVAMSGCWMCLMLRTDLRKHGQDETGF